MRIRGRGVGVDTGEVGKFVGPAGAGPEYGAEPVRVLRGRESWYCR
jgi:hypothetical protein